jgi:pimeloyl-ACP methyl ester carboxylesterase
VSFTEVNGTALRYNLSGSGASTLILIHEMGGTLESWDFVTPLLSAKRRILRYDTRGAGLSQKVRGALTIDTMVDDLLALVGTIGIAGKIALARRFRSRSSAAAGRAGGASNFRCPVRCARDGTLCTGADPRTIRPNNRRIPRRGWYVSPYSVACVPRITVAWEDRTPPLPCANATSQSFTCRAPHSPRSWRTASIKRNSPYIPG